MNADLITWGVDSDGDLALDAEASEPIVCIDPGPPPTATSHVVGFINSGTKTLTQPLNSQLQSTLTGNAMKNKGRWYWEMVMDNLNGSTGVGIVQMGITDPYGSRGNNYLGNLRFQFGLFSDGGWYEFDQREDTQTGYAQGDVLGFKMDLDTYTIEYNINGGPFMTLGDSNNASGGVFVRGTWIPAASCVAGSAVTVHTDPDEMQFPIPAGFQAISVPGGLDPYDGVFDVQRSDTDVAPFGEEGYLPVVNTPGDPQENFVGLYKLINIPGPDPAWVPDDNALFGSATYELGDTNQRANNQFRRLSNSVPYKFSDPEVQAGSELVGVASGFGFYQETTRNYVDDYQTETPVAQAELDAHQLLVDEYLACIAGTTELEPLVDPGPVGGAVTQQQVDDYAIALANYVTMYPTAPLPPVNPGPVGSGENVAAGGVRFAMDHNPALVDPSDHNPLEIDDEMQTGVEHDIIFQVTPSVGNGARGSGTNPNVVRVKHIPNNNPTAQNNAIMGLHDREAAGGTPYSGAPFTFLLQVGDPRLEAGQSIRVVADNGRYALGGFDVIGFNEYKPGVTQADVDAYLAAQAQYLLDVQAFNDENMGASGGIQLFTNSEALRQRLLQMFRLRLGSAIYDLTVGFPWDNLREVRNPILWDALIKRHVNRLPFVQRVSEVNITENNLDRSLDVKLEVVTTLGEPVAVEFNTIEGV